MDFFPPSTTQALEEIGGMSLETLEQQQLIIVSCYTQFNNLAHGPKGKPARRCLYVFWMDKSDGQMTLLNVAADDVVNPAFLRFHPNRNLLYSCTESVNEAGEIVSWEVSPRTGKVAKLSSCNAAGNSTCYLTLDKECQNMLVVNYWDASIGVFGLDSASGEVIGLRSKVDANENSGIKATKKRHEPQEKERQVDAHPHAVVLDPIFGRVAYVPDLGKDIIRQFKYDPETGSLTAAGEFRSGREDQTCLGPRYMEFHPTLPVCYVVNEFSSEVAVFEFDSRVASDIINGNAKTSGLPSLRLVQTVRTIPEAFPSELNTCGRICVHSSGSFVLVSNRGHDSITVLRVHEDGAQEDGVGMLSVVHIQHTRGATPRHFQFDSSGQWLITANQDSNNVGVFWFNLAVGKLEWTGHEYEVPSPNFVCSIVPHATLPSRARPQTMRAKL